VRRSSLSLVALLLAGASHAGEVIVDRVAAVVGEDIVALSEIYALGSQEIRDQCPDPADAACRVELEAAILDALIRRALIRQELGTLGYDVGPDDVDAAIQQVVRDNGFPDRETLRREVEATGATWPQYREKLEEQLRISRFQEYVLRNRITFNEEEVQDLYQRLARGAAGPDAPDELRLAGFAHKLPEGLSPDALAAEVQAMRARVESVRAGEALWPEVAEAWDTARVATLFEGRTFQEGELNAALSAAAFATEVGKPSEPVLFNGSLFVVLVLSRQKAAVELPPLEEVRGELEQRLFEDKLMEAEDAWYEAARRRTIVKVLLPGGSLVPTP
jgi:parvulin-like peptidyl-prolyl isomerase